MEQLADYIILHRLNKEKHGYMYDLAVESYDDIYNNIMSKGKTKLKSIFLGGNPVTLEKKDFPTLVKNEYSVSTKADGIRFLLMIGNKSEYDQRHLFFIDKNKDFWILLNNGQELPKINNIPNCLIDGELLLWGDLVQNQDVIRLTPYKERNVKSKPLMVFSCFDILYGPTNPEYAPIQKSQTPRNILPTGGVNNHVQLVLGSSGAFMGPKGGYRWPWNKRYSVLTTMLMNKESSLFQYNQNLNSRFKIALSPFVDLKTVLKSKNPYNYMKMVFDKGLRYQIPEIPTNLSKKTDGLILTPTNTEYLKDSWTFCGNDQFKWKPSNELTVDLKVGKSVKIEIITDSGVNKISALKGYSRRGKKLVHVGFIIIDGDNDSKGKVDGIVECLWLNDPDNPNIFQYKADRPDKLQPNAEKTVESVINAIRNPFSIKALQIVYNEGIDRLITASKTKKLPIYLKSVLEQLNSSFKLKCILDRHPEKIFTVKELDSLRKLIDKAKETENSELEARFKFPGYLSKLPYYNCIVSKLRDSNYITPTPVIKEYGFNNFRVSNVVLGDYRIKEESIIKTKIDQLTIKQNNIMKMSNYNIHSIDTVLSVETPTNQKSKTQMYRYQIRYEIDPLPLSPLGRTPSVLWRIDITEYGESRNNWNEAKTNYETNPQTQIEIEYAPGDQENSVWRYYEDNPSPQNLLNIVDIFNLEVNGNNPELVKKALDLRVLKLKGVHTNFILKDYCRLVLWILNIIYN